MELSELKKTWDSEDNRDDAPNLTPGIIEHISQAKYKSRLNRIMYPEISGVAICLAAAVYLALNLYRLDSPFLYVAGWLAITVLLCVSACSLLSIRQLYVPGNFEQPHAERLRLFAAQKIRFHKFQKLNILLSYLLLVATIILVAKLFGGNDISGNKYFWTLSFTGGYLFLVFFSGFVKKYYNSNLRKMETLLEDL